VTSRHSVNTAQMERLTHLVISPLSIDASQNDQPLLYASDIRVTDVTEHRPDEIELLRLDIGRLD
jgi:hypothetical protein